MDKLSVNTLFLSAASPNAVRRLSLVPSFTKSTPSSPTSTPTALRRKSMIEPPAVSDNDEFLIDNDIDNS
jgi:hypothetical protein